MTLTGESKFFGGIILFTVLLLGGAMWFLSKPEKVVIVPKETLITSATHTTGSPNAKVYLVEFSDFECPACGAYEPTVEKLLADLPNDLLFAYRHYPLSQHPQAVPAARAAEAAAAQNKFWDMHHALFANQDKLSETLYTDLAKQLALDMTLFTKDMQESSIAALIDSDVVAGNGLNVNATPTFYLNGVKLKLNQLEDLTLAVKKAIAED